MRTLLPKTISKPEFGNPEHIGIVRRYSEIMSGEKPFGYREWRHDRKYGRYFYIYCPECDMRNHFWETDEELYCECCFNNFEIKSEKGHELIYLKPNEL